MKAILNPRVVASCRARNNDIVIPMNVPRLFTANTESGEDWCGYRMKFSLPLQRRVIVANITASLVTPNWHNNTSSELDTSLVSEHLSALALPMPPPPQPDITGWRRLLTLIMNFI